MRRSVHMFVDGLELLEIVDGDGFLVVVFELFLAADKIPERAFLWAVDYLGVRRKLAVAGMAGAGALSSDNAPLVEEE